MYFIFDKKLLLSAEQEIIELKIVNAHLNQEQEFDYLEIAFLHIKV